MSLEIMETAKAGKPIWDSIVIAVGSVGLFLQSALSIEFEIWAKVFMWVGIGFFAVVRGIYWILNQGYSGNGDNRP